MHDEQDLKCRTGRAGISSEPISNEPPEERLIKNHYEEVWAGRGPAVPAIVCTLAFEADSKRLLARADRSASLLDCDILDRIRLVGLAVSLGAYMMINAWGPLQHFTQPAAALRRALLPRWHYVVFAHRACGLSGFSEFPRDSEFRIRRVRK